MAEMEVIQVSVRAYREEGGKRVKATEFVDVVSIAPNDRAVKHKGPGHPRIDIVSRAAVDYEDQDDPQAAFTAAVQNDLRQATEWLAKQDATLFEGLRASGCVTDLFIWIVARFVSESIRLDLPPAFLSECGRLGLTLSCVTFNEGPEGE